MVRHGTRHSYNNGCKCWACLEAGRKYNREYRRTKYGFNAHPEKYGTSIKVRVDALRAAIETSGMSIAQVCDSAGLSHGAVNQVLARGSCRDGTLDKIASALGLHMSSLEVA